MTLTHKNGRMHTDDTKSGPIWNWRKHIPEKVQENQVIYRLVERDNTAENMCE